MALPTLESLVARVGIPLSSLDQRCSDQHLLSISRFLNWRNVAPYLGLSEVDIEDIDYDRRSQSEKRLTTLRKWKSKYGYTATFKNLVLALLKIENTDHAEKVCQLLKPQVHTGMFISCTHKTSTAGTYAAGINSFRLRGSHCLCHFQRPATCSTYLGISRQHCPSPSLSISLTQQSPRQQQPRGKPPIGHTQQGQFTLTYIVHTVALAHSSCNTSTN